MKGDATCCSGMWILFVRISSGVLVWAGRAGCVLPARDENGRGSQECTEGRGLHGPADGLEMRSMAVVVGLHVLLWPWPDHPDRTPRCSCYGNKCPVGDEPTLTGWNIPPPVGDRVSGLSSQPTAFFFFPLFKCTSDRHCLIKMVCMEQMM